MAELGGRPDASPRQVDLAAFRREVADLSSEISERADERHAVAVRVADRMAAPELAAVLDLLPGGGAPVEDTLVREIETYRPNERSSASDLPSMVRIHLLSQIDSVWWGAHPPLRRDVDVDQCDELVEVDELRRRGRLKFRYRTQPGGLAGRGRDWAQRRLAPGRQPHTSGLRFTRARPESVALLNQLAVEFSAAAPAGTPPLWVTSMVRSVEHQHRLRALGYAAVLPSSHCSGHAADVEMRWFRRFDADRALASVLLEHQDEGRVNVIDEGQAWHVCISPVACADLRRAFASSIGG